MSILRVKRTKGYTTIPNAALCDDRLSYRARGVLAFLLAKPDDWETRTTDLPGSREEPREGRDAVRTALKELRDAGYMSQEREQYRDDTGKMLWETVTTVRDFPEPVSQGPDSVPRTESQGPETSCYVSTSKGASEDGFPGPVVLIPNNLSSTRDIEETTSLPHPPRRVYETEDVQETPARPGSKGWGGVRTRSSGPKRKSRKQEALEALQAERELDPAYVVSQALASGYPGEVTDSAVVAEQDDLAPRVRRRREKPSKRPSEELAEFFDRRAQEVGHPVPGATNTQALTGTFGRWMADDTDRDTIRQMIITYWSPSWHRSENVVAWKDFLASRGLLTGRAQKVQKIAESEATRYDESYWGKA